MEAARTSETLVNFYQTTRHYNPEDSHLLTFQSFIFILYGQSGIDNDTCLLACEEWQIIHCCLYVNFIFSSNEYNPLMIEIFDW
jgi:hypothetical protein